MSDSPRSFWHALGPGILFAGAAVGVSHLVQSTRAGAGFGLTLILVVILANLVKYPAFRFGPHYAAATGTSLLEGYRRQGRWALALYALVTLGTMFTVQAAVTIVTAGLGAYLAASLFTLTLDPLNIAIGLTAVCALLLGVGQYRWLDRISKVVVATLTLSTLLATALILPEIDWGGLSMWPSASLLDAPQIFFVAALVGWMPSAIDISVWQSLWTLERARDSGHRPSLRDAMLDFHIGYWGTAALAVCFLLLGAGAMFGKGIAFPDSAGAFAAQFVGLYVVTLGDWSAPIIGLAAFAVMVSTTLTVIDGFPRALSVLMARLREPESAHSDKSSPKKLYWASLAVLAAGSLLIISQFLDALKSLVDVATTLSFLTAPVLAALNHRAVTSPEVPEAMRPSPALRNASLAAIAVLSLFALYFIYLRFLT